MKILYRELSKKNVRDTTFRIILLLFSTPRTLVVVTGGGGLYFGSGATAGS